LKGPSNLKSSKVGSSFLSWYERMTHDTIVESNTHYICCVLVECSKFLWWKHKKGRATQKERREKATKTLHTCAYFHH
jgi:hypothetical protein